MKVEVHASFDGLDPERWNALVARAAGGSVFLTWQWQTEWIASFLDGRALQILTVVDPAGALAGVLPLYAEAAGRWRIVGGEDVSDYLDLAAAPGAEAAVWEALLQQRGDDAAVWDLRGLRPESPTLAVLPALAVARGLVATAEREERCPILPLPATWDEYLARLSGKDRHELRRKMRKLEAELPAVTVRAHTSVDGWDEAMTSFLTLHRASRTGKARFMDERMERFFRRSLRALLAARWMRLWFLESAGAPVAGFLCMEYGGSVGLYNSGFDPAHAKLAPGIVLLGHVIRDAIERGVPVFDFLRGEEPYKYSFGPAPHDLFRLSLGPAAP
ncbi:MAG: GNAT family N-acetyltransferase [Candidatus Rokuibacteriota bacterium]